MKDVTCQTCYQEYIFTDAEIAELVASHELESDKDIEIVNCPKCSTYSCTDCEQVGHA